VEDEQVQERKNTDQADERTEMLPIQKKDEASKRRPRSPQPPAEAPGESLARHKRFLRAAKRIPPRKERAENPNTWKQKSESSNGPAVD